MSEITGRPEDLLFGGQTHVPREVAVCPECGSLLLVEATDWIREEDDPENAGRPVLNGMLFVECIDEQTALDEWERSDAPMSEYSEIARHHWQSDWQPVIDAVARWCGAVEV